ncbi:uncharacterized protein BDR25DRAFT_268469, partial [Lindgomyces ingoldianus]
MTTVPSLPEQIDAFAKLRRYFAPEEGSHSYAAIQSYLSSKIDAQGAINQIAPPIEEAYTTGDYGRKMYLWDLYYSILHSAKRIPWTDGPAQEKLLDLMKALKSRSDPEAPFKRLQLTPDVHPNWVLTSDGLWSTLLMLGPSAREAWDDGPGCGAEFQDPEARAWANVNAFAARITRDGIGDWWWWAIWALRDALEPRYKRNEKYKLDVFVPAAAVWLLILHDHIWNRVRAEKEKLWSKEKYLEARIRNKEESVLAFNTRRWAFWRERFGHIMIDEEVREETRRVAKMA